MENTSEENILPIEGAKVTGGVRGGTAEADKNGIMFSTSYVVSYDENGKEDSAGGDKMPGLPGSRTR
jgi:hypothetical protein